MTRIDIEECDDKEKLKALCIEQYKQLFYIGETLVSESKQNISTEKALNKIRKYLTDGDYNCRMILESEDKE